jgi:hypothetical protein
LNRIVGLDGEKLHIWEPIRKTIPGGGGGGGEGEDERTY